MSYYDDDISPRVTHSRGEEPKAVNAIAKALNSRTIDMDIAGFFTAYELDETMQNVLMEYFEACLKNWCDLLESNLDERDANYNTVVKAKIMREALKQMGHCR
jgi:hypothetical protein